MYLNRSIRAATLRHNASKQGLVGTVGFPAIQGFRWQQLDAYKAILPESLQNINTKVLDDAALRKACDAAVFTAFVQCRATGVPMDKVRLGRCNVAQRL